MHPPPSYTPSQDFEYHDDEKAASSRYTPAASAPDSSGLKPWLGLRARIFLGCLSPVILSLLFVIARLLVNSADIDSRVELAREALLQDCARAQSAFDLVQSWPHYAAAGANARTKEAVEDTVRATGRVLLLALTAIDAVLLYIVDTYRSLLLCTSELVVHGSVALVMEAVDLLDQAVQAGADAVKATVQASISAINDTVKGVLGTANDLLKLVGQSIAIPQIAMPDMSALNNVSLPSSFMNGLQELNASLPTLDGLRQQMDAVISQPLDGLKVEINGTINNYTFDASLLPVPALSSTPISLCASLSANATPLDDFARDLRRFTWLGIGCIGAVILVLAAGIAAKEAWAYRSVRRHARRARDAFLLAERDEPEYRGEAKARPGSVLQDDDKLFSLLQLSSHPLAALLVLGGARRAGIKSRRATDAARWYAAWLTHRAALTALAIGVVGVLATQMQIVALNAVEGHYRDATVTLLDSAFSDAFGALNASLYADSAAYASRANGALATSEAALNADIFGWVNVTTSTMNATLADFSDAVVGVLNSTFGGTPLLPPVQAFANCVLLRKIAGIEAAISWVHANARADLPRVADDVLLPGASALLELEARIRADAVGSSGGGGSGADGSGSGGVLGRVAQGYAQSLRRERVLFAAFVGVYAAVATLGLAALLCSLRHGRGRARAPRNAAPLPTPPAPRDWSASMQAYAPHAHGPPSPPPFAAAPSAPSWPSPSPAPAPPPAALPRTSSRTSSAARAGVSARDREIRLQAPRAGTLHGQSIAALGLALPYARRADERAQNPHPQPTDLQPQPHAPWAWAARDSALEYAHAHAHEYPYRQAYPYDYEHEYEHDSAHDSAGGEYASEYARSPSLPFSPAAAQARFGASLSSSHSPALAPAPSPSPLSAHSYGDPHSQPARSHTLADGAAEEHGAGAGASAHADGQRLSPHRLDHAYAHEPASHSAAARPPPLLASLRRRSTAGSVAAAAVGTAF